MLISAMQGRLSHSLLSEKVARKLAYADSVDIRRRDRHFTSGLIKPSGSRYIARGQNQSMEAPDLADRSADEGVSTSGREVRLIQSLSNNICAWPLALRQAAPCVASVDCLPLLIDAATARCQNLTLPTSQEETNSQSGGGGGKDIPYGIIAAAAATGAGITGYLTLVQFLSCLAMFPLQ